MLSPGSIVGGRYQIVRAVGRGGMGEVYEAMQVQLARRVALKTIRADLAARPDLLARFRREAESAAALGHPNLVQVTDFYAEPGEAPFLVMEMLDGTTLAHVLEQGGRVDPARAAFIAVQLLSGLAAAHCAGIVHRDVKPANIFLQSTTAMRDLVKVLDFGVAKLALEATPGGRAMTQDGQVLGTLSYMAPEQGVGGPVDARTDIYGVGATLFHALSGVRPFDATEPGGGRTPLDRIAPWVSRDLAAIIERALQKAPDARWPSADEMAAALQPFVPGGTAPGAATAGGAEAAAPAHASASGGWNPAAIGRLEAPTGGSSFDGSSSFGGGSSFGSGGYTPTGYGVGASAPAGAVPITMPQPYGPPAAPPYPPPPYAPSPYPIQAMQPMHPMPQPMHPMHGGASSSRAPTVIIAVVALIALSVIGPYLFSFIAYRNATNPSTIATNVEREVLKQPKQPCPVAEQCSVTREEHGLTYTLCTQKRASSSSFRPGEMVLAGKDSRIALVTSESSGRRYNVRFLTAQQEQLLGEDEIVGRLCRPAPRGGSGQTVP